MLERAGLRGQKLGVVMIATESGQLNVTEASAKKTAVPTTAQLQQLMQLFNQGRQADAKAAALALIAQSPQHGIAWKLLGVIQQQQGALSEAATALQKAVEYMPKDAEAHYNLANVYYDQQQLNAAKNHYQQAVKLAPQFAQAHYNLGSIYKDLQQLSQAETSYKKAQKCMPKEASIPFQLGLLLQQQNRFSEAVKYYQQALELSPNDMAMHLNLGISSREAGQLAQAEQAYRNALALDQQQAGVHNHLGIVLKDLGRIDEAEVAYQTAIALDDTYVAAYKNLGLLYQDMGKVQASESCYIKALSLATPTAETLNNLVAILINQGRYDEAETQCRKALSLDAKLASLWNNLGLILQAKMQNQEAETAFEQALALQPNDAQTLNNYSVTLKLLGKPSQAEACLQKALRIKPDFADAYLNLGNTYLDQGLIPKAIAANQQVLALQPDHLSAYDNLLFGMTYSDQHSAEERMQTAQTYGRLVSEKARPYHAWFAEPQPTQLRVGIVSGDLRQHPVAYFLKNILQHLNPKRVALFAYTTDGREDATTRELKPYFAEWKSLAGHNDEAAASIIHQDELHVLLDLSGHTASNKLPIFAWKPAPVQASWLGYWATTGVAEMDYVLVDEVGVPAEHQKQFTETVMYLPDTRLCFSAPTTTQPVSSLPALNNGYVTFGCFQNLTKVSDQVLALWGRVMQALPNASLRWQCKNFADEDVQASALARLAACGISKNRVHLHGKVSREDYLAAYAEVDMVLDSFPFTGGTTTCEALWMGVPTLTLAGNTMVARQGASLMAAAGLVNWIVMTADEYVEKATEFANDLPALATLRTGLRAQVAQSALFDGQAFAEHLEHALWHMWQQKLPNLTLKTPQKTHVGVILNTQTDPKNLGNASQTIIDIVSATRMTENEFWQRSALGQSLRARLARGEQFNIKVSFENTRGLSQVFNDAITQADDDAILVFIHDDVWIDDANFTQAVTAGLTQFDVIGVAGNKRRLPKQPAWAFVDTQFTWDAKEHLSGRVAHGQQAFGNVSDFGEVPAACELMDGVFLAAKKQTLVDKQVSFDPQFDFHFYDLDFCRSARKAGLTLGTWPIQLTHQSGGAFGTLAWQTKYQQYLTKWENEVLIFELGTVDEVVGAFNAQPVLPEIEYISPPVPIFGNLSPNPLVTQTCTLKHPAVYMAEVSDLTVIGTAAFPIIQNKSILHQYFSPDYWETQEQGLGFCSIQPDKGLIGYGNLRGQFEHAHKVINLIGNGSNNYAHWLTEYLPQLVLLKNAGVDLAEYRILVDALSYPSMLEALYLLGIKPEQIIKIDALTVNRFPSALWVSPVANVAFQRPKALHGEGKDLLSEPTHAIFHPLALQAVREAFLAHVDPTLNDELPTKIFIKRTPGRKANVRMMVNEQEIEALLVANGFTSIDPSKLTFMQQVTLFSRVQYIVSASGAALVNMLWAPKGAQVLVLMNDTKYANYWYFSHIATANDQHLAYVLGNTLQSAACSDMHHANFEISVPAVLQALEHAGLSNLTNTQQAFLDALQDVMQLVDESEQAGDVAMAMQLLEEILQVKPDHAEAHHRLGVLLAQQSNLDAALLNLESAVQHQTDNEQYWVSYIDALMMLGEYVQADAAIRLGEQFGLTAETSQVLRAELTPQLKAIHEASEEARRASGQPVATICTLIPAYKPKYIEQLLLSLTTQTYSHFKVIISDDNPNGEVTALVQRLKQLDLYKKLDIAVVPGPKKGGFVNIYHVVRSFAQEAEFFHIMMDDDLIYPTFYETHMREHAAKNALVSISARWNAIETGQPYGVLMEEAMSALFSRQFDAATIAKTLIPNCSNKLGEFSHAVFRREAAEIILNPSMRGISYFGLDDIGSFIQAAQQQPAIWIPTPLGIFRNNPEQNTGKINNNTIKCGHYAWIALALIAVENRWISADEAWTSISIMRNAVRVRYQQDALGQQMLAVLDAHEAYSEALKNDFLAVWNTYLTQLNIEKIVAGDLSIQIL